MGTKLTTTTVVGFNSSPPADDGSTSASNQGFWATIKTKLADPFNTFASAIDGKLTTALDKSARLISASDVSLASDHDRTIQIGSTVSTAITVTLGDAVSMAAGYMVTVNNQSAINQSVTTATSSNTINSVASNTLSIPPKGSLSFLINSAATGYNVVGQTGAGNVLLTTATASVSATIDFTGVITSAYDEYLVVITNLSPATDGAFLSMRVSEDGGSTFKAGATDYFYTHTGSIDGAAINVTANTTSMAVAGNAAGTNNLSNAKPCSAEVRIFAPSNTAFQKVFRFDAAFQPTGGNISVNSGGGSFTLNTSAINGIRFLMNSGNITSGNFALYGVRKT